MPDEPPSILPRGTIIRPPSRPCPQPPASAVYIQSVTGFCCSAGQAAGIASWGGGAPPASTSATRHDGSSDSLAATTAPADPPPTTTKSNESPMGEERTPRRPPAGSDRGEEGVQRGVGLGDRFLMDPVADA